MGRKRKHDRHLPRYMRYKHGAYYFVRYEKWHPLGKVYSKALCEYAGFVGETDNVTTVAELLTLYIEHKRTKLAAKTIENYLYSAGRLNLVFGHMRITDLEPGDVCEYLLREGNVMANRDKALLSAAYSFAIQTRIFKGIDPTKKLGLRNTEQPRERYVTDLELDDVLAILPEKVAVMAKFLYLTGMRQCNGLTVKLTDITEQGVNFYNTKSKKWQLIELSDELDQVIRDAKRLFRRFGQVHLFESRPKGKHAKYDENGRLLYQPYTTSGFRSLWKRYLKKNGIENTNLHDLRKKAASDVPLDHAAGLLGHSDPRITQKHYRHKVESVAPVR